jgi:hypothetical protein
MHVDPADPLECLSDRRIESLAAAARETPFGHRVALGGFWVERRRATSLVFRVLPGTHPQLCVYSSWGCLIGVLRACEEKVKPRLTGHTSGHLPHVYCASV